MVPHPRHAAAVGLASAVLFLFPVSAAPAQEGSKTFAAALTLHPPRLDPVVTAAVLEAHRRLEESRCRELFRDFEDAAGRTPQENLDAIGLTGQSYLGWLWFVDGSGQSRCGESEVLAFTVPGSRVIYYCGDRFRRQVSRRGLGVLAVAILHEELHSLGVGENPPSSLEITRRVEFRCGS